MRILIDECLPRRLKFALPDHDVATVQEMGWSGVKNGALLSLMVSEFHVFVTIDGNLEYQQNLSTSKISVVVLQAANNKLATLLPLMADVQAQLHELKPGEIIRFST